MFSTMICDATTTHTVTTSTATTPSTTTPQHSTNEVFKVFENFDQQCLSTVFPYGAEVPIPIHTTPTRREYGITFDSTTQTLTETKVSITSVNHNTVVTTACDVTAWLEFHSTAGQIAFEMEMYIDDGIKDITTVPFGHSKLVTIPGGVHYEDMQTSDLPNCSENFNPGYCGGTGAVISDWQTWSSTWSSVESVDRDWFTLRIRQCNTSVIFERLTNVTEHNQTIEVLSELDDYTQTFWERMLCTNDANSNMLHLGINASCVATFQALDWFSGDLFRYRNPKFTATSECQSQ
jgi:hypothetical protein